jgi:hypothetical protein
LKDKAKVLFSVAAAVSPRNFNNNHEALDKTGVKNTSIGSPDTAHEFLTWRGSPHELAPLRLQN